MRKRVLMDKAVVLMDKNTMPWWRWSSEASLTRTQISRSDSCLSFTNKLSAKHRWGNKTFKTLIVPPWTVSIDILPRPRRRSYSDNNELKIQWYSFEINEGSFYKLISSDSDQVGQLRRTGIFLEDSLKSCIWDNSDVKKRILNAVNLFGGIQSSWIHVKFGRRYKQKRKILIHGRDVFASGPSALRPWRVWNILTIKD